MLWIIDDRFSQDWEVEMKSFISYSKTGTKSEKDYCALLDTHMTDYVGDPEAKAGYIILECEDDHSESHTIYLACDTDIALRLTYRRVCECVMDHPHFLDIRGIDVRVG